LLLSGMVAGMRAGGRQTAIRAHQGKTVAYPRLRPTSGKTPPRLPLGTGRLVDKMQRPGQLRKIFGKFGSKHVARFKSALKKLLHGERQVRDNPDTSAQRWRTTGRANTCGF
jgi:hypothetical protein